MKIENGIQRLLNDNGPSAELLENTVQRMKEEQWASFKDTAQPVHGGGRRRLLAVGLAAALVLTLTVGAGATGVFTNIFARFAGQDMPGLNDRVVQRAEPVEIQATEMNEASPLAFQVTEASCDGRALVLGIAAHCTDPQYEETDTVFQFHNEMGKVGTIEVNGKRLDVGAELTPAGEPGLYSGVLYVSLPDAMGLENRETLDVTVHFPYMRVLQFPRGYLAGMTQETRKYDQCTYSEIRTDWTASFTLDVDASFRTYELNAQFGGVVLEKVVLGEAGLECTFTIPEDMDTNAVLTPLDDRGEPIYPNTRRQGGNWKEDGQKNFTMFLAAPAKETHALTFTVVDWPEEPGDYYGTGKEGGAPKVSTFPVLGTYTLNLD